MKEFHGLFFDPNTGKTYIETPEGEKVFTGFTFEDAEWTGPFGLHFSWPKLNPFAFATMETAETVLAIVTNRFRNSGITFTIESRGVTGPFTRTPERVIRATSGNTMEEFSAGWLANSIIRNGVDAAMKSFKAELVYAGLMF